jgi:hypothetical protein
MFLSAQEIAPEKWDSFLLALRYLARHQTESGAWGQPPANCRCPREPERPQADKKTQEHVARLLVELGEDDVGRRDAAIEGIIAVGESALTHLEEAVRTGDKVVAGRCSDVISRLKTKAKYTDVGITALALLGFMTAGYSQFSKDQYDQIVFGDTIGKGLRWLMKQQDALGCFSPDRPRDNAIAAFALSEAYEITGSSLLGEKAAKGVAYARSAKSEDVEINLWKGMTLLSWELGGGENSREQVAAIRKGLTFRGDPLEQAGNVLLAAFAKMEKDEDRLGQLLKIDPSGLDPKVLYFTQAAILEAERLPTPRWRKRFVTVTQCLGPDQRRDPGGCVDGSWGGEGFRRRLEVTAYFALALEQYPRKPMVFIDK